MSTKRRLTLMPEILPTPRSMTSGMSSVRERTLARLKVLAALGAAGLATGCGRTVDSNDGGLPDGGGSSSGSSGDPYGVVDPLPPPSCFKTVPTATASYVTDDDGGAPDASVDPDTRRVSVALSFQQTGVVVSSVMPSNSSDGTNVVSSSSTSNSATFLLSVPRSLAQTGVGMTVSCYTGPSYLLIQLTLGMNDVIVQVYEQ